MDGERRVAMVVVQCSVKSLIRDGCYVLRLPIPGKVAHCVTQRWCRFGVLSDPQEQHCCGALGADQ